MRILLPFKVATVLLIVLMAAPSSAQFEEIDRVDLRQGFNMNDIYGIATNNEDGLIYVIHLRQNTVVIFDDEFEEDIDRLRLDGPQDIYGMDYNSADNTWWVADRMGNPRRIFHYELDGELLDDFNSGGDANGVCYCPENEHLYVACTPGGIIELTDEGEILERYQQDRNLTAIEYYPPNGTLLAMDTNDRVYEFTLEGEHVNDVMANDVIQGNGLGMDYNPWTRTLYTTGQEGVVQIWEDNYSTLPEPEFDPEGFEVVVSFGLEVEDTLTITNVGEEESILRFSLDDVGEGEVDWLECEPTSGMLELDETAEIILTIATIDLGPGDFERTIIVNANNPEFFEVEIQVLLTVIVGYGELRGTVTDAATDQPIPGAVVLIERFGFEVVSDDEGVYLFDEIPEWIYNVLITAVDYLPQRVEGVEVIEDSTTVLDFAMLHSVCKLSIDDVVEFLSLDEEIDVDFTMSNPGNGPLTWSVERIFHEEAQFEPWEYRSGFAAADSVNDNRLNGVEFDGECFYVSGGNNGEDQNLIYVFDREGNYQRSFPQFRESPYGMRDLAWDGEYLWGGDADSVYGFTPDGELVYEFEGPLNLCRCIAWDPDRKLLWICDVSSDIIGVNRDGEDAAELDCPGDLHIYGLAWFPEDPDGYNLYLFCSDGELDRQVNKVDVESGEWMFVTDLEGADGRAGGLAITGQLDQYSWVYVGLLHGNPDAVGIWQIVSRTDWLAVEPDSGVVEAKDETELTVHLSSAELPPENDFTADLRFSHDGVGEVTEVPVRLAVTGEGGVMHRLLRLELGWNLLSVNIEPEAEEFVAVVQPLVDEELLVLAKDGAGNFYWPSRQFSNIERWVGVEGYLLKVLRRCEFRVGGDMIPWDSPIALDDGWNLVSYLPRRAIDATVALSGLGEALVIAKDGRGRFYLPAWGFSDMGAMVEGQGYQLKVEGEQELVYRLDGGDYLMASHYTPDQLTWLSELPPTGSSYSLLLVAEGLPDGSRVEAYTSGGVLAGRGVVGSDGRCGLTLWGDDPLTEAVEGFQPGEVPVVVEIRTPPYSPPAIAGRGKILPLRWLKGGDRWKADDWGVARLEEASVPVEFGLYSVYPNPFNSQATIRFGIDLTRRSTLKVLDLMGREVAALFDRTSGIGHHQVVWDASTLPSGLYIVRLESAGRVKTIKVALIR